jgi:GNAT superfamily N-acetyltransferase
MSITFTNFRNPAWEEKIFLELHTHLEKETGLHTVPAQGFHSFFETQHIGSVIFKKQGHILWIDGLFVDAVFRRQKIGTKLIDQVIEFSMTNDVKWVQLNTFFPEARDFFKSCQFEETASLPNWKYGLTSYFMKRTL